MDYVDILWVHAWEETSGVDEVMRALDDLVRAGDVLYVGVCNTPAWVVSQANTLADLRGWSQFVGMQIEYSLTQRVGERDLLPMADQFDRGARVVSTCRGRINRQTFKSFARYATERVGCHSKNGAEFRDRGCGR